MANSPMFRATRAIDDLSGVLSRLGVEYAANLTTLPCNRCFKPPQRSSIASCAASGQKQPRSPRSAAYWPKVSLRCVPTRLARQFHPQYRRRPMLSWAEHPSDLLNDSMTLDRVIDSIHGSLGTMILQSWNFPPELVLVPSSHTDFTRKAEKADYIDVVTS